MKLVHDGNVIAEAERIEWDVREQGWRVGGVVYVDASREMVLMPSDAEAREAAKITRAAAVEAITVTTTAGNTFDGDEPSQIKMDRAIATLDRLDAALAAGTPITLPASANDLYRIVDGKYQMIWVLADNSVEFVSAAELAEAAMLAGAAQTAVWVIK